MKRSQLIALIAGGVWIVFLMIWIALGIPMGPGYAPTL